VHVAAVRQAPPVLCTGRQPVPLDHGDAGVPVGEHPCRQQAGDAAAQDDGALTVR
jgi:hypothetical protein